MHPEKLNVFSAKNTKRAKPIRGGFASRCALRSVRFLSPATPGSAGWRLVALALVLLGTFGCRTMRPLPPANLSEPGWTVRHGQAVWHLPQGQREIAGEVLVATRNDGQSFVQFTKNPFPLVTAQATPQRWAVEFPPQNKHYAGRGAPPKRVIWLYLPKVLTGQSPPKHWTWHQDAGGWKLENHKNGESLEGYFES